MENCDRCLEPSKKLETFSYRVVCQDGTINMDVKYCTKCCDEIEQESKEDNDE